MIASSQSRNSFANMIDNNNTSTQSMSIQPNNNNPINSKEKQHIGKGVFNAQTIVF